MADIISHAHIRSLLGDRPRDSHKGKNGRALLLAGSPGFSGAALMAAAAALRGGVGTLKVLCPEDIRPALYRLPEAMSIGFAGGWDELDPEQLNEAAEAADCIAIGPGIGKSRGAELALRALSASKRPLVIDADGLNVLAMTPKDFLHGGILLTPHIGEMARLIGKPPAEILQFPEETAKAYAAQWGCSVLLKGAESYIAAPDGRVMKNISGNPGLAKGGSGDVLTGIALAMLSQGLSPFDGGCAAAYLLGSSADRALDVLKERMLMARDVLGMIQATIGEEVL